MLQLQLLEDKASRLAAVQDDLLVFPSRVMQMRTVPFPMLLISGALSLWAKLFLVPKSALQDWSHPCPLTADLCQMCVTEPSAAYILSMPL